GTFYISDYFNGLNAQIPGWKKAATKGHELANHTIWHACEGGRAGREFISKDYDFRFYSVRRAIDEIRGMNNILKAMDGKDTRTFAYPCGDTKINDTSYIDPLRKDFIGARGVRAEMPMIDKVDLYYMPCYMMSGQTGEQMIDLVKQAMEKNALLVFLFHGVGGEHGLNVALEEHRKLLKFLQQNQKQVWVAPMLEVAEHIKKYQLKKS
ncbi:MAG TPA: polysaccharide deacetylase family protein, partial [Chitinophagaceae bacterium]|nr:polysaccharide deacetylase family protein [Chitinophagaceae bacterium]